MLLDEAINWVCRGVAVIPIYYVTNEKDERAKKPDLGALRFVRSVDATGRPIWEPFKTRLPEWRELLPWFGASYRRNLGIVTGWRGLTILDFDDWQAYADWRVWAAAVGGHAARAAESYQVTSSRGVHVYVYADDDGDSFKRPGLDVLGKGKYALGAGSIHPSGHVYRALDPDVEPVHVPSVGGILPCYTEQPPVKAVKAATSAKTVCYDPWRQVDSIHQYGNGLMQAAKAAVCIEDVLPDITYSGTNDDGKKWGMATCPFHDDRTPSLAVNLTGQVAFCRAGCDPGHNGRKGMDVINLVAYRDGRSLRDAALYLLNGGR